MNETNEVKKTSRSRKKKPVSLLTMALLILAVLCTAGVTAAFLKQETDPVVNTFTPGSVTPSIVEEFDGTEKKSVTIQNTGNSDAYIRAAVIGNRLATGSVASMSEASRSDYLKRIVGPYDVSDKLNVNNGSEPGGHWFSYDGYYYWNEIVKPGDSTGELIDKEKYPDGIVIYSDVKEDGRIITVIENNQVTILTEAIQAKGEDSTGKRPVTKAWGIGVDDDGYLINPALSE